MNSPADDIAQYLQANTIGVIGAATGWSINVSKEPSSPDTTITVYDTPGFAADYDINLYQPSVQIKLRGHGYQAVYSKAEEVEQTLIAPKGFTQNSRYVGAWQPGSIESLGYDENDRAIIVMNINLMREA